MPDEILTLPEVARLLKVAEKTVYTMAQIASPHSRWAAGGFSASILIVGLSSRRRMPETREGTEMAARSTGRSAPAVLGFGRPTCCAHRGAASVTAARIDFDRLLKLRLVVARWARWILRSGGIPAGNSAGWNCCGPPRISTHPLFCAGSLRICGRRFSLS